MQPQALLLQRPHEALDHPVALRLADERRVCWMPSQRSSAPKAWAVYCGPQSVRIVSPRATSLPNAPNAYRTPWWIGSSAAQRSPRFVAFHPTISSVA